MQNYVFVLNADRVPLDQVHPARARELQSKGKAKPIRQYPYVLILQSQVENPKPKQYTLKIDPGSEWTGFAIQCGESIHQPMIVTCRGHGNRQARRANASGFPAVKNAKEVFHHVTAGDIVKVCLDKDRKIVKAGIYTARVKTPTKKGCEVLINGNRIGFSSMQNIHFIHRSDGYAYGF